MNGLHTDTVGLSVIEAHSRGLAALARRTSLGRSVPSCGDWRLADLVHHLAEVQAFWAWVIGHRPAGPNDYVQPERPSDAGLVDLLERSTTALLAALEGLDPEEPAWSWSEDHTVGFTVRRQSHEALIHHIDGIMAAEEPLPEIDPRLAADGVDEMVNVNLGGIPSWATFARTLEVLALRATDTGDSWILGFGRVTGTSPASGTSYDLEAVVPVTDPPDATVEAPALTLDLWLWGREPDSVVTVEGAPEMVARLRGIIVDATQ